MALGCSAEPEVNQSVRTRINKREAAAGPKVERQSDFELPDFADLSARVYRLCLALLGSADRASDAAQESLTRAWARRADRRSGVSWWTWAAGFAVRVCRETGRHRPVEWTGELAAVEPQIRSHGPPELPQLLLHAAINALPDRQREVTVLRFLVGMSTRDTAETLGCPQGTVKSNLHKAIANLQANVTSREASDGLR